MAVTSTPETPSYIKAEQRGPAGIVHLARPEKRNALTRDMLRDMLRALDAFAENDEIRGVVLFGSDDFFSTGVDLAEALEVTTAVESRRYQAVWRNLESAIEGLPKPVIAAIGGYCVTGGLELALTCDLRIASENAQFAITSPRIGSVAGMGATQRLPRIIGEAYAKEMLFTADYIDAATALRYGLINRCVPKGTVLKEALAVVDVVAQRAPLSIAWHKLAVHAGRDADLRGALELEAALSAQAFATEDKKEGMSAFLQKRQPVFQGR